MRVDPDIRSRRTIAIDAPASAIWPWLLRLRVRPGPRELAVGDAFALGPTPPVMRVAAIEAGRSLVLASEDGHWVWSFTLAERDGRTRLVSRNRIASLGAPHVGLTRRGRGGAR